MNKWMAAATVLMGATVGLHVFGGGPEIHEPIQASELTPYLRAISAVLWHAVTIIMIVFTGALAFLCTKPNPPLAWSLIATQVGFSGLFLFYGATLLGTLWVMPQWTIFLSICVLMLAGMREKPSPVLSA